MCWKDCVSPSTSTTILLTLIVVMNVYLVILTAQNKGAILRQQTGDFEVSTSTEHSQQLQEIKNTAQNSFLPEILSSDILDHDDSFRNDFVEDFLKKGGFDEEKTEDQVHKDRMPDSGDKTVDRNRAAKSESSSESGYHDEASSDTDLLQKSNDKNFLSQKNIDSERTVVLLVSDYRSGSSLLGEMFNQNDDVFYLFEPLIGVVDAHDQKRFLERLLSCTPRHWGFLRRSRQSGCGEFHVDTEESVEYRTCLKNTNRTTECLKYGITAAKFIRLTSIHSIRDFGILDRPNVFVVHSFRDPRGTINSRLSYDVVNFNGDKISRDSLTKEIVGEIAQSLCERYYDDSVFGDSLHKKYIRITYEDVCTDPETNIRRVYDMIGHAVPQRVLDWFSEHTHARSTSAENDKMGLERNSALTAVRWKEELPHEFICAIERNCRALMDYLQIEYMCDGS